MRGRESESIRKLIREHSRLKKLFGSVPEPPDVPMPKTRSECVDGVRPCPFIRCRYNLFLEVRQSGTITFLRGKDVAALSEMQETCALDVAASGPHTLDTIAKHYNMTRERARQEINRALKRVTRKVDPGLEP